MREVRLREVVGVRELNQLVGWTQTPEPRTDIECVCVSCVQPGNRDLMRRVIADLLGLFRWADVTELIDALLVDPEDLVRATAVDALVQLIGPRRAYAYLATCTDDTMLERLVDHLAYEQDVPTSTKLLAAIEARAPDERPRAAVARVSISLLREDDLDLTTRAALVALTQG